MRKRLFVKKITALSLCAVLLLPAGAAAEGPSEMTSEERVSETTAAEEPESSPIEQGESTRETSAEGSSEVEEPESSPIEQGESTRETSAEGSSETEETELSQTESGESVGETSAEEPESSQIEQGESTGETSAEENTSTGYVLERFTLYNGNEMTMDIDNLKAELDVATVDDISGVRFLIDSGEIEAGYIAVSYINDKILIVLHGGLSGQTVKYKIDSETLTTILNSDAFTSFLRGRSVEENSSDLGDQETEAETTEEMISETGEESEETEPGTEEPEMESETGNLETEVKETEELEISEERNSESGSEAETSGTGSESEETEPETEEPETESETGNLETEVKETEEPKTEPEETEESGTKKAKKSGTKKSKSKKRKAEAEEQKNETGETEDGFIINGISLTKFVRLVNEARILLNESIVKDEKTENDQKTFYRSGIVLNRENMNRLLEVCSELGIDGGMKENLDIQNIRPEGGALLWGADGENYKTIAGSFGISVGDEAPVWDAFGADITGREMTLYNYRMPEQQAEEIENGVEIVFSMIDTKDGTSWVPVDDTDAINLTELEPSEAIEEISGNIQMVLYDMMGGVLSVVLEEMPEEMVSDMLGIDTEEETMSESESETEADSGEMMSENTGDESGEEAEEAMSGDSADIK